MNGLNSLEAKAARLLFPYFTEGIIFDIGSNKGFWSDILIHNVKEAHLFEPNERLLTYTMVKYDYLNHVKYNCKIILDKEDQPVKITLFHNQNNGLSNIFDNPKWDYIEPKIRDLKLSMTIDEYVRDYFPLDLHIEIDMIKIDVEGADFLVLQGMKQLLTEKKVKFIQIENSEHIKLSGHAFQDAIDYMAKFGYDCYDFDGEKFIKITEPTTSENLYFIIDSFTQDWNKEFIRNTKGIKANIALEIGCFEGLTTRYICDNLLTEGGRIICIDPLTDEYLPNHPDNHLFKGQYDRFIRNTRNYPVELIRKRSHAAWDDIKDYRFDFIYIDGDHSEQQVYEDGVNSLRLAQLYGWILFDDYEWREETRRGIDKFIANHQKYMQVIDKGYQVKIQKTAHFDG